ncbi:MAG: hypothetical protein AAGD92_02510 [Pseudomonadota bacterium]
MRLLLTIAAGLWTFSGAVAFAQNQQTPQPSPCQGDQYRAFDFWLGEWDVFTPNGQKAGVNKITSEEQGCLILERWTSAAGGTGQSYNYYDPGMKKWRQIWVNRDITIDYSGGLNDAGKMTLEGEIAYRNGTTAPFKGVWTLQNDGTIRQHFEQYNAQSDEWQAWFTGIYKKRE